VLLDLQNEGLLGVPRRKSLGWWAAVAWDPRRSLPTYSEAFIGGLAAYTRHNFPGKRFEKVAPAVPRPPHQETAGSRSR
jgi:hypothetical protein